MCPQFRVLATDLGGIYALNSSNQATVGVTVKRNKLQPRFERPSYSVEIAQTQEAGSVITTVSAADSDDTVRLCSDYDINDVDSNFPKPFFLVSVLN